MPYNEWGDENPKYEALKEMYEASKSFDEWSYQRYQSAKEDYERIIEGESYQGGA